MREKLAEYASQGGVWPVTACILDPIRTSIVCSGPAQILEVPFKVLYTVHNVMLSTYEHLYAGCKLVHQNSP